MATHRYLTDVEMAERNLRRRADGIPEYDFVADKCAECGRVPVDGGAVYKSALTKKWQRMCHPCGAAHEAEVR